jgi:AraC-like DNA-binding protein
MAYRVVAEDRPGQIAPELRGGEAKARTHAALLRGIASELEQSGTTPFPYCVVRVLEGRVVVTTGSKTTVAEAGQCVVVPSCEGAKVRAEGLPARWIAVSIDDEARNGIHALHLLTEHLDHPVKLRADGLVGEAIDRMAAALQADPDSPEVCKALDALVVALALEQSRNDPELGRCPGRSDQHRSHLYDRMMAAKARAHATHGNVSIAELAEAAGLSPWYFVRTFHTVFGVTPYQYALDRRMAYARHLLLETGASVREIALEVGFGNSSAFVRAFGQRFGQAPTRVRRGIPPPQSATN